MVNNVDKEENYDEITLPIKLQSSDEIWIRYFNIHGKSWQNQWKSNAHFTGLLLYKI